MVHRVGIFGGSFNPVHNGHISIAQSFLDSRIIHDLWIIPSPDPPHKTSEKLVLLNHRIEMLNRAFSEFKGVSIKDFERTLSLPSYTVQSIEYLKISYPETLFYLCIGADSLVNFTSWYKYKEILQHVCLLVADRPGFDIKDVPSEILDCAIMVDHQPIDISSSRIRKYTLTQSEESIQVPGGVMDYIFKHKLYSM